MLIRRRLLVLLLAAALAAANPILAQSATLSLNQAAELVRSQVGGKVLAADVVRQGERTYYLVRVLVRPGKVKVFRVDPTSGEIF